MRKALLACLAAAALVGCIRRYAAPEDPAPSEMPYSALAVMQRIRPPAGTPAAPLPARALRLAVGPEGWLADTALLDAEPVLVEGEGPCVELLRGRSEAVVVLVDAASEGDPALREVLDLLGSRAIVALGRPGYGPDAPPLREPAPALSRDPLGRGD